MFEVRFQTPEGKIYTQLVCKTEADAKAEAERHLMLYPLTKWWVEKVTRNIIFEPTPPKVSKPSAKETSAKKTKK